MISKIIAARISKKSTVKNRITHWPALVCLFLAISPRATAIIFNSTGDPLHNTTSPGGVLSGSGWDHQGLWGGFLGTPISPYHFITAKHVGGSIGEKFHLNGMDYTTTAYFDDPIADLRIWQVREQFPAFTDLYSKSDEVGKNLVVFGRGTQRGADLVVPGLFGNELKGWMWGESDGRKRWGENRVGSIVNGQALPITGNSGDVLKIPFDAQGGSNEAHLSVGDSGGGLFIKDGEEWKLAGINYAVDGPYNTSTSGAGFHAAVFDEGGLYKGGEGKWQLRPNLPGNSAGAFYATRISTRINWIKAIISAPVPQDLKLLSAQTANGPYEPEERASINQSSKVISLPRPANSQYFIISGATEHRITTISIQQGQLEIRYQ